MDKFIKNIEEMPKDWQEKCKDGLKSQIEAQAIIIREDQPSEFLAYIEGEIAKASDSMNKLVSHIGLQGAVLGNISQAYVWNKERKRVLEKMKADYLSAQSLTPEPQQMELKDLLPERLKGDSALRIFQRAIDAGMIEKTATGFKWNGTKARLAYFLGHFLVDGTFPDAAYCELFNENRLAQAYYRLGDNKCGDGKPRGYEEIDALFVE